VRGADRDAREDAEEDVYLYAHPSRAHASRFILLPRSSLSRLVRSAAALRITAQRLSPFQGSPVSHSDLTQTHLVSISLSLSLAAPSGAYLACVFRCVHALACVRRSGRPTPAHETPAHETPPSPCTPRPSLGEGGYASRPRRSPARSARYTTTSSGGLSSPGLGRAPRHGKGPSTASSSVIPRPRLPTSTGSISTFHSRSVSSARYSGSSMP
jgi:hypothetical protein